MQTRLLLPGYPTQIGWMLVCIDLTVLYFSNFWKLSGNGSIWKLFQLGFLGICSKRREDQTLITANVWCRMHFIHTCTSGKYLRAQQGSRLYSSTAQYSKSFWNTRAHPDSIMWNLSVLNIEHRGYSYYQALSSDLPLLKSYNFRDDLSLSKVKVFSLLIHTCTCSVLWENWRGSGQRNIQEDPQEGTHHKAGGSSPQMSPSSVGPGVWLDVYTLFI